MNPLVTAQAPYPMNELIRQRDERRRAGQDVIDFGMGDPVEPTPDFIRETFAASTPSISQYPPTIGTPAFRRAAAAYLKRRFGVDVDPDTQILATSGSKEAIFHVHLALVNAHDKRRCVLYPNPGYPVYDRGAAFAGATAWPVLLRADSYFLLEPWELARTLLESTALCWVNVPHNPTGATAPLSYYVRCVSAAREHGFVLCSDECYQDLYFEQKPSSALQVGAEGVLAFHSLSKRSAMTGYRIGFVAGDPKLIAAYAKARTAIGAAPSEMVQAAAVAALQDDTHVQTRRDVFRAKREVMLGFLKRKGIHVAPCDATFYLWVRVPEDMPSQQYATRLLDAGVLVSPGTAFGSGGEGWLRIALVPTLAECTEACERWAEIL